MKILILGIGQSNFLNQLYSEILRNNDKFQFYINNYFDVSGGKVEVGPLPYEKTYNFKSEVITKYDLRKAFFKFLQTKFSWKIIFFEISQNKSYRQIKRILFDFARAKHIAEKFINPLDFDIIHFHFCVPENLKEIYFLNSRIKTVCTFWGSDLMRLTGVSNVFYMKKALELTDAITVQTPELAEILYAKYGRKFNSKLTILRFTLGINIFKEIDAHRNNISLINEFKNKYSIPLNKTVVALGHNAFPENNHLLMIEQIKRLSDEQADKFVFLLHLGYGGNESYSCSLKKIAEITQTLHIIVINDFFNEKEIALFRLSTDILIQMPVSDALSAAMTEVLYAGNTVITGAWLPYGFLRRNGIHFLEIDSFNELPQALLNSSIQTVRVKNGGNTISIKQLLFPEITTPPWIQLFKNLVHKGDSFI